MSDENQNLTSINGGIQTVLAESLLEPQIIYLDFDGELTNYHNDELNLDIENVLVEDSGLTKERIKYILDTLNEYASTLNVMFVSKRPANSEYSTIYIGNTSNFKEYGTFAGIAESVDIRNENKSDKAFVLLDSKSDDSLIIDTILHEALHICGALNHEGEGVEKFCASYYDSNYHRIVSYNEYIDVISDGDLSHYDSQPKISTTSYGAIHYPVPYDRAGTLDGGIVWGGGSVGLALGSICNYGGTINIYSGFSGYPGGRTVLDNDSGGYIGSAIILGGACVNRGSIGTLILTSSILSVPNSYLGVDQNGNALYANRMNHVCGTGYIGENYGIIDNIIVDGGVCFVYDRKSFDCLTYKSGTIEYCGIEDLYLDNGFEIIGSIQGANVHIGDYAILKANDFYLFENTLVVSNYVRCREIGDYVTFTIDENIFEHIDSAVTSVRGTTFATNDGYYLTPITIGDYATIKNTTLQLDYGSIIGDGLTVINGGVNGNIMGGHHASVIIGHNAKFIGASHNAGVISPDSVAAINLFESIGDNAVFDGNVNVFRVNNKIYFSQGMGLTCLGAAYGKKIGNNAEFTNNTALCTDDNIYGITVSGISAYSGAAMARYIGDNCSFAGNKAVAEIKSTANGLVGGGAYWGAHIGNEAIFSANSAIISGGGIIYACGGGVSCDSVVSPVVYFNTDSNSDINSIGDNSLFTGNKAIAIGGISAYARGGALYIRSVDYYTIGENAIFSGNMAIASGKEYAEARGGAIYINCVYGWIKIGDNAVFTANRASEGGAIYNSGYVNRLQNGNNIIYSFRGGNIILGDCRFETYTDTIVNYGVITINGSASFAGNIINGKQSHDDLLSIDNDLADLDLMDNDNYKLGLITNNGTMDFNIAARQAEDGLLLNIWKNVQGDGNYTITVGDRQVSGKYQLIGDAANFDKTITVKTESGQTKGELYLGMEKAVNCNGVKLLLKLDEETNVVYVAVNSNYSKGTDREKQETELELPKDAFDTFAQPTYTITKGPDWLEINEYTGDFTGKTGKISGTATGYGDTEVIVKAMENGETAEHHIDMVVVPEEIEGAENLEIDDDDLAEEIGPTKSMTDLIAEAVKNRDNHFEFSWAFDPIYWKWMDCQFYLDRSKISVAVTDTEYSVTIQCELRMSGLLPRKLLGDDVVIKADLFGEDYFKLTVARDFSKLSAELVGTITIENIDIANGLFTLESAELSVKRDENDPDKQILTGKVDKLRFAHFGGALSGDLTLVDGAIDRIVISVSDINYPFVPAGWFLTSIGAGVENLQSEDPDKPVTMIGKAGFRYGAEVRLDLIEPFTFFNGTFSIASMKFEGRINENGIRGNVNVTIAGGVITGNASAELDWTYNTFQLKGGFNVLERTFVNAAFKIDGEGNFTFAGTAMVDFSAWNYSVLGSLKAEGGVVVTFTNDGNMGNDYAMLWGGVVLCGRHVTLGGRVYFNGKMEWIGNKELQEVEQEMTTRAGATSGSWNLANDEGIVLLVADWEDGTADADVRLTDAEGNTYSLADLKDIAGIELVDELSTATHKVIALDNPKAGVWSLSVDGVEDAKFTASIIDEALALDAPTLDISLNENRELTLSWDNSLLFDGERVSIFYDNDAAGYDGCLIASLNSDDLISGSYTWTMPNLYSGTFNFYVMVDADNAIPVFSEYSKSITVQASLEEVDFDVDSTYIYVDTGYTITGRTIANGVTVIVNGGIVNGIILEDGASLRMYGDSVLKGAITIDGGANVVEKGHLAGEDVDLHLVMPEKVNENAFISNMETWDVSSLTITIGNSMELGRYLLATDGGARGISATLTSADGTSLGTVSTNTSIRHDDRTFSLEMDSDQRLYLAVQGSTSPHVTADITTPTTGNVTVTAEYDDDCVAKEYSLDGETWKKYSKSLVVKENGSLYFRGKYQDGTYTAITRYDVTNIDRVVPDAPTVKADVTALTNKPVTVTATFSSDSVKKEYSLDGTTWRDYTAGIVFNDNGAVYFRGKDAAGNVSEIVRYDVTNIDVVPPATPVVTASETKPTNGDVTVSAVFSDDSVKKEYSLDGVTWMDYAQAVVFNENGSVLFRGIDAVGNVSEIVTYIVSNIDKTAPAKPVLTADITETTDGNVTVTAAFDADTSYAEYRIDGGDWIRYGGGVVMSRNGKVAIRAVDTAGNVSDIVEYIVSNIEKIGPVISMGGKLEVSSGDVVDYAVISSGGSIVVSNGGTANQTAVKTDGELWIYDSGIANYTTVSAGGNLIALDGGVANEATVKTDGWMVVAYEGVANSTHISSGGILAVRVGGTASETIIYSSGYLDVSSGGTADETTVSQGGRLWVWSDGSANSTTVSAYGGAIVKNMGNVSFTDVSANGYLAVSNGATAVSTTVNQMGQMFVSEGGTAIYNQIAGSMYGYNGYDASIDVFNGGRVISTVISSGGELIVSNGGTASDVIVNGKGALFVINGGTALRVKENGGAVFVNPGANVTFVPNVISNIDFGLEDSFEITLHSGTTAMSATHTNGFLEIYSGGMADSINDESVMMVYDGGLAKSTTVGYELHISSGGTAIMTVVSGGSMNVSNGGVANQTTVNRGSVMVEEGGSAVSTTIHSGGAMAVSFGGTATSTTVNASGSLSVSDEAVVKATTVDGSMGRFFVSSGGTATSTTVASGGSVVVSNSGTLSSTTIATSGKLIVSNGGTAKDLILYNGGSMVVYSGGILKGSVMLAGMMTLSGTVDASNASITFDVSQRTENSSVLIANFNHIDTVEYFVTVAANQTEGQYRLAGNAADFNGSMTLTVKDTNLTTRLSRDTVATVGRKNYSLVVNSGILWLTVTGEGIPAPINLSNTNNELLWTSVEEVTGYFIEYSRDGFKTVITVETETVGMEQYNVGVGTWQWRVKAKEGAEWAVGNDITISSSGTSPTVVSATEDGVTDAFFGRALDTWNGNYEAQHVGIGEWNGTNEIVELDGKNQITDVFAGSDDASILLMTDDANGDALFIEDIYSAFPEGLDEQARLAKIDEIRAGAGDDIVDLTSQRFDYIGGGMTVRGGLGDDVIWANNGDSALFGDAGNDRIVGAGGNDVIVGGSGDDSLHGGGGEDIFAFGGDWGHDSVEQLEDGKVTLWFEDGSLDKWDAASLTYRDGDKSVVVSGVAAENISLKFGDDGSEQYGKLLESGAFDEFSSERIFENKNSRGMLA